MLKVIFLCTGNSCRSQMAEGFARELGKGLITAYSAGLSPQGVNPKAVAVMKEIGIDISQQQSKAIDPELLDKMDTVITLCDNAAESCPWTPPAIKRIHWSLKDPAHATGSEKEVMNEFRRVRDEIKEKIVNFLKEIADS
jgi:arsenate reductase (thioredoxin)